MCGSVFRRWLGGKACAMEVLGSLMVYVEEIHHVKAHPHHDDHKEEISSQYDTQKEFWIDVCKLCGFTVSM